MSFGVVINGPEGVVLASDSRATLTSDRSDEDPPLPVNFDSATKLPPSRRPTTLSAPSPMGRR
jgi:hypothetical protein